MITGYLHDTRQRFLEFGGFMETDPDHLPGPVAMWTEGVLIREEEGLTTLVALLEPVQEGALRSVQAGLTSLGEAIAAADETEALSIVLLALDRPLTREEYETCQALTVNRGRVRAVVWIADLVRGRLFSHSGPPFGIDPDLTMLASPEPAAPTRDEPGARVSSAAAATLPQPRVTLSLLVMLAAIWLAMTLQGGSLDATAEDMGLLAAWGAAQRPDLWLDGDYWRFFTANFVHIGIFHLAVNGFSLWMVGRAVEFLYGPARMVYVYLVAGVAGSVASAVFGPPVILSAGASGAIFGLLGAVIWYRLSSPLGERIAWRPLLVTLVLNLGIGLALANWIDNWNHLGGLAGGLVAAAVIGVPAIEGLPRPRFFLTKPVRTVAAALVLLASVAVSTGFLTIPALNRDLAFAMLAVEEGRYEESLPVLRKAAEARPKDPIVRYYLFEALVRTRQCRPAEEQLRAFLTLAPDYADQADLSMKLRLCYRQ